MADFVPEYTELYNIICEVKDELNYAALTAGFPRSRLSWLGRGIRG